MIRFLQYVTFKLDEAKLAHRYADSGSTDNETKHPYLAPDFALPAIITFAVRRHGY